MNITLHAAAEQIAKIMDEVDPETGELSPEYDDVRRIVEVKATAVAAYILQTEKQTAMVTDYAEELLRRAKSNEKRIKWLKRYLAEHMAKAGITKISDDRGIFSATLAVGRDKSIDVFDAAQLPADYLREIPAKYEPDKTLIRKAIDDGFDVPGARLVAKDRLTIK